MLALVGSTMIHPLVFSGGDATLKITSQEDAIPPLSVTVVA